MANKDRWRCLAVGCNPALDADSAALHAGAAGHRVAKWPVRSAEGQRRAKVRNRTGYYDRYNVGAKSAVARGIVAFEPTNRDDEAMSDYEDGREYA